MPYKDKHKDRLWHKNHMRLKRKSVPKYVVVTPPTLRDADGNVIYDE